MRRAALVLRLSLLSSLPFAIVACGDDGASITPADAGADATSAPLEAGVDATPSGRDAGANDATIDVSDARSPGASDAADAGELDDAADSDVIDATDASPFTDASDASDEASGDAGTIQIRVANASSEASLEIDFCIASSAAIFSTPRLHGAGWQASGVFRTGITQYLTVPAGPSYVRAVAMGDPTCATPLDGVPDVAIDGTHDGARYTVVLLGSAADGGAHPLALHVYADEAPTTVPQSHSLLRLVHAAPSAPPIDVAIGPGAYAVKLESQLAYGQTSSASTAANGAPIPDVNGYLDLPLVRADLTAAEGSNPTVGLALYDGGVVRTALYLDTAAGGREWMVCEAVAAQPILVTRCETYQSGVPQTSAVQFLHAAPDAPAVDVCARVGGLGPWRGPLLAASGLAGGQGYRGLSGPISIPATTDTDLVWVPAGSPCTARPITQGLSGTYNGGPIGLLYEDWIGSGGPTYFGGCLDPGLQSDPADAFVSTVNVTSDTVQLTGTPSGGAAQPLGSLQWLNPGTYSIVGSGHVFDVTLRAGEQSMWLWHHGGKNSGALTRCDGNVGTLGAGASSTCTN